MSIGVSPDNFIRAESDLYFGNVVNDGGFGKFHHIRELSPIDNQLVIRQNRDTLVLGRRVRPRRGPADHRPAGRGRAVHVLQVITEDHYVPQVIYSAGTLPDTKHAFGTAQDIDPVRHLICSASAWGGNPEKDALYLIVTPPENDGTTDYRLSAGEVPVDGFWSVTVYNANGYFTANPQNAYSLNNLTSQRGADGSVEIRFGGCDGSVPNCLPSSAGWNYLVRLYRPRQEILDGSWTFPGATAV